MKAASCRQPPAPTSSSAGFTLIEMLITMVVLGILAAVVYPSFMDSIRKGRRSDAVAAVNAVQQAQERFRAGKISYATSITAASTDTPPGLGMSANSPSALYTLGLSDVTAANYTVIATAAAGKSQVSDTDCVRMAIKITAGTVAYGSGGALGDIDYTDAKRCWSR